MELWLEALTLDDTDAVFALTSNPDVAQYMRFDTQRSREEAADLIRQYTEEGNFGYRVMSDDGKGLMGVAALKRGEEPGEYSVSIFMDPRYWNQGYSTRVIGMLIEKAEEMGIGCLSAYIVEENTGSRKIMEKWGFQVKQILHFGDLASGLYVYWRPLKGAGLSDS